jgi:lysophospholipase L1-like esterase
MQQLFLISVFRRQLFRALGFALVAAAIGLSLPLLRVCAQQEAPAEAGAQASPPAAPIATPIPASPQTAQPEMMDPRARERDLGLMPPANPSLPSLILIGDSTVRNGHGRGDQNLWGWGAPIVDLFDTAKINVVNRAIGGLSSHSYIMEGHWDLALEIIKPGDFVLVQWGHNDGGINLPGTTPVPDQGLQPGATPPAPPAGAAPRGPNVRGSLPGIGEETYDVADPRTGQTVTVHTYGWYLREYIRDVKEKGATPIICSLVPRKIWVDGHIRRNTDTYRGWAQQVAEQEHVGFVDLNEIIARRYDGMGPEAVDGLFGDPHTHTDWAGAAINAEAVVSGLRDLPGDPLAPYLSEKGKAIAPFNPQRAAQAVVWRGSRIRIGGRRDVDCSRARAGQARVS